jgi:hypothetical protein
LRVVGLFAQEQQHRHSRRAAVARLRLTTSSTATATARSWLRIIRASGPPAWKLDSSSQLPASSGRELLRPSTCSGCWKAPAGTTCKRSTSTSSAVNGIGRHSPAQHQDG